MPRLIALVLLLPSLAVAQDRLPTPDYHRQPSDPAWLVQVADGQSGSATGKTTAVRQPAPLTHGAEQPAFPAWSKWTASPSYRQRGGARVTAIIYHYTAGDSLSGAVSWFQNPASKVSAHYVVGKDGEVVQMVALEQAAWHAGKSELAGVKNVNDFSVGIEIVNWGKLTKRGDKFYTWSDELYHGATPVYADRAYWEPFTDAQYKAVVRLTKAILERYPIQCITGHSDIAKPEGRKIDPGPAFEWRRIQAEMPTFYKGSIGRLGVRPAVAAASVAAPPIKAFCIDFNWGPKGINGFAGPGVWADASPEEHVRWYEGLGANVIQTFAVSCNGYAWYKGGIVPPQPGLKHDFLTDVVRLGHAKGLRVMGYYCVGANTLWGQKHPDLSYGTPSAPHVPLTTTYLDYLCGSMEDALKRTGMDGFMIDWVWNPSHRTQSKEKNAREQWLECEKAMYAELMGQPFPGEDRLSPSDKLAYERKALDRCWSRIHAAAKQANPKCVIWLSCHDLKHPTVIDSKMFREIDWLMNEHPDPASIAAVAKMAGPHTQLVQCLVGWGDKHDARKVLENPEFRKLGIYGFARPSENSLPLAIADYRSKPVGTFKGNDKNIAVLLRYFHGLPFDFIEPTSPKVNTKQSQFQP